MSLQGKKLQTKSSSRKNESKEETAEKVKAIRDKQSQWMKEREASKSSPVKPKSLNKEHAVLPDVPKFRARSNLSSSSSPENAASRNPYSNPRRKPLYPEPQRDHSDVVSWISKSDNPVAKKQRPPSASSSHKKNPSSSHIGHTSDHHMKYTPSNYGNSSSVGSLNSTALTSSKQTLHNKLRPSSRTSVKSDTGFHGDDKLDNRLHVYDSNEFPDGGTQAPESAVNLNESQGSFQNKAALTSSASLKLNKPELSADVLNALADTVAERLKTSLQPSFSHKQQQQSIQEGSESGIASHSCPLCEKLMTGPRHTPMAAIPCGHTYCQACLRDCKKCPTCQTVVKSTAVNTVIQQIITDFKVQKEKERLQKLEEQTRQYVEEYQSLVLRCNTLNGKLVTVDSFMSTTKLCSFRKIVPGKIECWYNPAMD